jgi:hypothetical protein
VYGVDIVVSQPQNGNNDVMDPKEDSHGSVGTQSNPIFIQEDPLPLALVANQEGHVQPSDLDDQLIGESFIHPLTKYETLCHVIGC